MTRLASLTVILVTCLSIVDTKADDRAAAEAHAATIAPFIDDEVIIVGRVDLNKLDVAATAEQLAEIVQPGDEHKAQFAAAHFAAKTMIDSVRKAGCSELYAVVNLADIEHGPFVIAAVNDVGNADKVAAVIRTFALGNSGYVCEPLKGAVYLGPRQTLERLKTAKAKPRPEFKDAFAAARGRAFQLLFVPSKDHRRVLSEMLPTLPKKYNPSGARADARGLSMIILGVDSPPKLYITLQARMDDEESAWAFITFYTGLLKMIGERPAVREAVPSFDYLVDLIGNGEPFGEWIGVGIEPDTKVGKRFLTAVSEVVRGAKKANDRQQCMNNLKHLGLAMHIFHDAQKRFPAVANYDKNGKPLLSWRVHVLPYFGYEDLHKKFRLDEPWDSDHNKKLIPEMPSDYACPAHDPAEGKTLYLAPHGKGLAFEGKKGTRLKDGFGDGTSNTILVVEVDPDKAVIWTKPVDLEVDLAKPLTSLGKAHPKGFNATFGDGSVHFLSKDIDVELLKALFTRNSGDEVKGPF